MNDLETVSSRKCTKCFTEKSLDCFSKAKGGKYGKSSRCRECAASYAKANRSRINEVSLARYYRLQEPLKRKKLEVKLAKLSSNCKLCPKCKQTKIKSEFGKDSNRSDGLKIYCKPCHNACNKEVRERNPQVSKQATKNWYENNKSRKLKYGKNWINENRSRSKVYQKNYKTKDPVRYKKVKDAYFSQIHIRIKKSISTRIRTILISGKEGRCTKDFLDFKIEELITHLEKQFLDGMSWSNYGEWHIDHIIPLSSFKFSSVKDPEIRAAWALSNLRPLWAEDNHKKHAKIEFLI